MYWIVKTYLYTLNVFLWYPIQYGFQSSMYTFIREANLKWATCLQSENKLIRKTYLHSKNFRVKHVEVLFLNLRKFKKRVIHLKDNAKTLSISSHASIYSITIETYYFDTIQVVQLHYCSLLYESIDFKVLKFVRPHVSNVLFIRLRVI